MAVKTRAKRKRQLPISGSLMRQIKPITPNQEKIFKAWDKGKHLFV